MKKKKKVVVLTDQQIKIVGYTCEDLQAPQIATKLSISSKAVHSQWEKIKEKYGVKSLAALAYQAVKHRHYVPRPLGGVTVLILK